MVFDSTYICICINLSPCIYIYWETERNVQFVNNTSNTKDCFLVKKKKEKNYNKQEQAEAPPKLTQHSFFILFIKFCLTRQFQSICRYLLSFSRSSSVLFVSQDHNAFSNFFFFFFSISFFFFFFGIRSCLFSFGKCSQPATQQGCFHHLTIIQITRKNPDKRFPKRSESSDQIDFIQFIRVNLKERERGRQK